MADQASANAIAAKVKAGASLAAAGGSAAVTSLKDQTRAAYAGIAGDKMAAAVFSAPTGAVVGPIQSDFGWVVAKVDLVRTEGGKSLAQAHSEIAAKLNIDKRKQAIEDVVDKVQNALDEGNNFAEAAAAAKIPVSTTPLLPQSGAARADPGYKLPAELAPALKTGFEIAANDPPEIVSLPNDQGYVVVSPAQIVPAAPAPLASIREQVASDWIMTQATQRAKAVAEAIAAKAARGVPLAQALKEAMRRCRRFGPSRPGESRSRCRKPRSRRRCRCCSRSRRARASWSPIPRAAASSWSRSTRSSPATPCFSQISSPRCRAELQQTASDDYAREFVAALRQDMKVKRNEAAIQALKTRLTSSGG